MRPHLLLPLMTLMLGAPAGIHAQEVQERPLLIVSGDAELSVEPDQAVVRLGAVAQAEEAAAAQDQVNQVMQQAIAAIRDVGVAEQKVSTAGISLSPVYSQPPETIRRRSENPDAVAQAEPFEPRIVGYRAYNTLRIEIDDLEKVGPVIDAGVNTGANRIEGVSFGLEDDREARSRALQAAAKEARAKARQLAQAMEIELGRIWRLEEQHVGVRAASYDLRARAMAFEAAATPVQPGQVHVVASVRVQYRLDDEAR